MGHLTFLSMDEQGNGTESNICHIKGLNLEIVLQNYQFPLHFLISFRFEILASEGNYVW